MAYCSSPSLLAGRWKAVLQLVASKLEGQAMVAEVAKQSHWTPSEFLGRWMDPWGNAINIVSTDAFQIQLLATVSFTATNKDRHLRIKSVTYGGGWQCGRYFLDPYQSLPNQIVWVDLDGSIMTWDRVNFVSHNRPLGTWNSSVGVCGLGGVPKQILSWCPAPRNSLL